jgi:V8-like Glu-specific endopeptidase
VIELGYNNRSTQPYLNVGLIITTWEDGSQTIGTCSLVGRNDILTAGHCVYDPDKGGWATNFEFYFGTDYNSSTKTFQNVISHPSYSEWQAITWPSNIYTDNNNDSMLSSESQYDIALIGLDKPIGDQLGWLGLDPGYNSTQSVSAVGYPLGSTGMMQQTLTVTKSTVYDVYTSPADQMGPGSSGGPLLVGNYVIGVKSATQTWADISSVYDEITEELLKNDSLLGSLTDTTPPTISIGTKHYLLHAGEIVQISFTLSEPSSNFTANDVTVSGGILSNFTGSGTTYTALFTPTPNSTINSVVSVASGTFTDAAGNSNIDGDDYDNKVTMTVDAHLQVINGTTSNDIFVNTLTSNRFDGGDGLDVLVYSAPLSSYTITKSTSGYTVTAKSGTDGIDTLTNIERIQFTDRTVALDIDGNAGQAYRLYQAAFARTPDNGGLKYWIAQMDSGVTLEQVSNGFLISNEFKAVYGANPTVDVFVGNLYRNVLHRAPDAGGFDYWSNQIKGGLINERVLIGFSESNENVANVIGVIQNGIELY